MQLLKIWHRSSHSLLLFADGSTIKKAPIWWGGTMKQYLKRLAVLGLDALS